MLNERHWRSAPQLKDVEKLLKLDPTNTELLAQKQKLLTEAVSETKEKLETLKTAAEQANTALANGEISQEQYDALQREIIETEEELKKLETQAEQSATALQKISATGEKLQSVGDSVSSVGMKLMPVTAGVVALGTAAVTTAANFETAMSSVKALISSSSTDIEGDMEKLEEAARSAGETTKFSATEAAEAMSYMEKVLTDVLGLDEFDEDVFLSKIDVIYVPKSYVLEIHFKDGRVMTKGCPNTGHQECWTPEYRERVSKQRRKFGTNPKGASCLTAKIKCEQCGCNFRKQTQHHTDGSAVTHWRCSAPEKTCGTVSLREDLLKQMTAEVLGIDKFDDDIFLERINHISVISATELVFHMKDGSTVSREWVKPKKTMPPWTEERREKQTQAIRDSFTPDRRQAMSEKMKQIRSEKYWASTKK